MRWQPLGNVALFLTWMTIKEETQKRTECCRYKQEENNGYKHAHCFAPNSLSASQLTNQNGDCRGTNCHPAIDGHV